MAPKFGTSGLRGLVTGLTPELVEDHVRAFLAVCNTGQGVCLGRDLRPSSPRIAADVIRAATGMGVVVIDCGEVPTPALAMAAQARGAGAIMVTGSHIPADRNGLKFYAVAGEITKADETAILRALGTAPSGQPVARVWVDATAGRRFVDRYLDAFGPDAISGRRLGLYAHSAVGRDLLAQILSGLGAEVIELGRSDRFIPVDTEAVDSATRDLVRTWVAEHRLDALVSTDGDSDRPLLADETGQIVPGDILGQITAELLEADTVVTPISSNGGVTRKGFRRVERTRIGSPHVIAAMRAAGGRAVGYEANGGFLLGFDAWGPAGPLAALPTRDCVLPLLATLASAAGGTVSARVAREPAVVTLSDRLQDVAQDRAQALMRDLAGSERSRQDFLGALGLAASAVPVDLTDGVRMTLNDGRVVHVRPSGNAPEMRLYVEAGSRAGAEALLAAGLAQLGAALGAKPSG